MRTTWRVLGSIAAVLGLGYGTLSVVSLLAWDRHHVHASFTGPVHDVVVALAGELIGKLPDPKPLKVMVSEAGASVYSASELAAKEFSDLDVSLRGGEGTKSSAATAVGTLIAERARAAGVEAVVFDRGGRKYHGRIAALADGAREAGLRF